MIHVIASVFSKTTIAGTTSKMRDAMELVASRVDQLGKSKIVTLPSQPTPTSTTSSTKPKSRKKQKKETAYAEWDSKQYRGTEAQRKQDRENRRLVREKKQKQAEKELARKVQQLQPLGEDDEAEAEPEPPVPDPPVTEEPPKAKESVGARNKRLELERRKKAKADREAEIARAAENAPDPPEARSTRKGKSPARSTKDQEPPEVKSPKTGKSPGRSTKGQKTPKAKQKPSTKSTEQSEKSEVDKSKGKTPVGSKNVAKSSDGATSQEIAGKTKNVKNKAAEEDDDATRRPVAKKSTVQHVDDENYELDMNTGKFVKKRTSKKKPAPRDDDDDDDEIEEIDDVDKDADYDPDKELDQGDDEDGDEQMQDEDDDDFPIPEIRGKAVKTSDKSTSQKKKKVTKDPVDPALADLADFVEETFKRPTRQSVRKVKTKGQDACINPDEAARFQKAMKMEALELEKAVRKGKNVSAAYKTLVTHVIEACKDMKYDIPADLEADDIFPTIHDPECKAWRLKLQGVKTAGEGELNVSKSDNSGVCVARKQFGISDVISYVEEVSSDWSEVKRKNFLHTMKKVMGNMTAAHRMVAEASNEMLNLLDEIDLPLWMKACGYYNETFSSFGNPRNSNHVRGCKGGLQGECAKLGSDNESHHDNGRPVLTFSTYSLGI